MFKLRNMTIKRKLTLVIMLTCTVALLLAGTAFVALEQISLRADMVRNLTTEGEVLADNCKAALSFEDAEDARETLSALRANPAIVYACVRPNKGDDLANYYRGGVRGKDYPEELETQGHRFDNDFLVLVRNVVLEGKKIGTICLISDLEQLRAKFLQHVGLVIAVILSASLIAYLISSGLQRVISKPVQDLALIAKDVSEKKDYSTRAEKHSNDEVGLLIDAFNEMLEQIQQRDSALIGTNDQLEEKVRQRTAELTSTVEKLELFNKLAKGREER
ncbi:MAG: CHASE sensor domain-containing protein, partial [Planctomycetota bacterium]